MSRFWWRLRIDNHADKRPLMRSQCGRSRSRSASRLYLRQWLLLVRSQKSLAHCGRIEPSASIHTKHIAHRRRRRRTDCHLICRPGVPEWSARIPVGSCARAGSPVHRFSVVFILLSRTCAPELCARLLARHKVKTCALSAAHSPCSSCVNWRTSARIHYSAEY